MTADYELVPEPEAPPQAEELELPQFPGAEQPKEVWVPLREYDDRRVPEGPGELLARALPLSLKTWVTFFIYYPIVAVPLAVQYVPGLTDQGAFPLPGQIVACFVLSYAILERANAAYDEAERFDITQLPLTLLQALFLTPLFVGLGRMPLSAYAVIPVAVVLLPLVLGALATQSWGELTPRALYHAATSTPGFLANTIWCAAFIGSGLAAVWAWPEGNAAWRGAAAAFTFSVAGTLCGAARLDAEVGR